MEISITVEGWGLDWDRWKKLTGRLDSDGYATIFKCDHFSGSDENHLETYVALTQLALQNPRANFGTLVSPLSFREPVMMARQAMAIDDLSDGHMILGLGAGWMEQEHEMYGYTLGSIKERMDRFEEGLEVISQLIRRDEPVTFDGQYYQLQEAILLPHPKRPTPILIGGQGLKRTMPLVAKYADIWNCDRTLDIFKEANTVLDSLLQAEGRQLSDVKRTNTVVMGCWQTDAERDQILSDIPPSMLQFLGGADEFTAGIQERFSNPSPTHVIDQLKRFEDAGCEELVIHYFGMNGDTQLDVLAEHILLHFQ